MTIQRSILLLLLSFCYFFVKCQNLLQNEPYPFWPSYNFIEFENLDTIKAQPWINKDHVINGWDWSLPDFVEPSPRSAVGLQRNFTLNKEFLPLSLQFKSNKVGVLWVKWRDLEPKMGKYKFRPLINRINQANKAGFDIILRIVGHSKLRGYGKESLAKGDAPLWLEDLGVNFLPRRDSIEYPRDNLNFDPSHPVFHKHYLKLIDELAKNGIPEIVKAAYVGYASPTNGDEGIGPFAEHESTANDTVKHVIERLDAWGEAFKGMEEKVFMGGSSHYGFKKGFGVRRGFVEMYMYNIPNGDLGQFIDEEGYLSIDDEAPILKYNSFNGDENEEYGEKWATAAYEFRFGTNTKSFPYRYFTSSLRALQMRCNYLVAKGHLIPKMLPFISQELGRTVEDAPDVWSFLHTSYIRAQYYENRDYRNRVQSDQEKKNGIETKNFERWLYQRDAPGYTTQPAIAVPQPVKMWMIQPGRYYDYVARSAKKIGFYIDNRWQKNKNKVAVKITYLDKYKGELTLKYNSTNQSGSVALSGDEQLKTATLFIEGLLPDSMDHGFDFTLEAGKDTEEIIVLMVRIVESQ